MALANVNSRVIAQFIQKSPSDARSQLTLLPVIATQRKRIGFSISLSFFFLHPSLNGTTHECQPPPKRFLKAWEMPDSRVGCDLVGKVCSSCNEGGGVSEDSATIDDRAEFLDGTGVELGLEDSALRWSITSRSRSKGDCTSA